MKLFKTRVHHWEKDVKTPRPNVQPAPQPKYWYKIDVYACVLCGKEDIYKERVYNKIEAGTKWHDYACGCHF